MGSLELNGGNLLTNSKGGLAREVVSRLNTGKVKTFAGICTFGAWDKQNNTIALSH